MSDLISRQAAFDACHNYEDGKDTYAYGDVVEKRLKTLPSAQPSAQPERKKGKWIIIDSDEEKYEDIKCPNCKMNFTVDACRWCDIGFTVDDLKFCPNCGADMRGEQDG